MKKSFQWLFVIFLIFLISPAFAVDHFEMTYAGTINNNLKVHLKLKCDGEVLSGSYSYDRAGVDIPIRGKIDRLNRFTLQEYGEPGKITGVFEGRLVSRIKAQGEWMAPNSSKRLPFELKAVDLKSSSAKAVWTGDWTRTGSRGAYGGYLFITKVTSKSFNFSLDANSGGATGAISGKATIVSHNRATWQGNELGGKIEFVLFEDLIAVDTENCDNYAGYGVIFDGDYRSGAAKTKISLLDLGVFTSEIQEKSFQRLVGEDYDYWVDTFGADAEESDLDGFGAKVYRSWMRGLAGCYDALIMVTPEGRLWVAKIFMNDTSGPDVIKYYTNDSNYYSKLPRTIEKWKNEVIGRDLKVIFCNDL